MVNNDRLFARNHPMTEFHNDEAAPARTVLKGLWLILAPLLAVGAIAFAIGIIAGAQEASGSHGSGFYIALALAGLILAGAVWLTLRILPAYKLPRSPRMRQGRLLLYASALLGVAIGAASILFQGDDPRSIMRIVAGMAPIPQALAWLLVAGTGLGLIVSVRWHRLLDEHERAAYDFGAVAALYVYFAISIIWWLLWRAEIVPVVDGVAVFVVTTITWMLGWLIRRYR
jgi:hypothetical protein